MPVAERSVGVVHPVNISHLHSLLQARPGDVHQISPFEGLPKGSNPSKVARSIHLIKHATSCSSQPGKCPEGEGCLRAKQVLRHHIGCKIKNVQQAKCNVCRQLLALCQNHSDQCKVTQGNCAVPYCRNKKVKSVSSTNNIQPNANTQRSKQEYQHVIRKLSEAMNLPTKKEKLRGVERLLETNRQATVQVLRYIIEKKQKSQPNSLNHQMKNLTIGKGIKALEGNCSQVALNPKIWSPALTCYLKLTIGDPLTSAT